MWERRILDALDRRTAEITFDPHVFERKSSRNLEFEKIKKTVREGHLLKGKCQTPNKICFEHYFGKENQTYVVVTRFHHNFIEVKTAWIRKGN